MRYAIGLLFTLHAAWGAINVADFGAKTDGSDTTPAVRAALDECRRTKASKLIFPPLQDKT